MKIYYLGPSWHQTYFTAYMLSKTNLTNIILSYLPFYIHRHLGI